MKKIVLLISILVFSFSITFFCFASELSGTTDTSSTYSLSTNLNFRNSSEDDFISAKVEIVGMPSNYVVIPYFRYSVVHASGATAYFLNCCTAIYDKNEDITYIPTRSNSENNFVKNFYDSGQIKLTGPTGILTSPQGFSNGLGKVKPPIHFELKSNNDELPYYFTNKFCEKGDYPFSLSDVKNPGTWFIVGNNYPFPNPVYSTDIYYPSLFSLQFTMDESLSYRFGVELQGTNILYTNLDNYYLEIFASTNKDDTVIYQSSYKLTDLYSDWYQSHKVYSVIDNFFNIFPNMNPHQDFTVFVRCRYMDNNVNLVSKYQFYVQPSSDIENPDTPKFFQGEGNLPTNLAPGSIQGATYPQSSFDGNYSFGDFNALNFVKGGGGLPSLVNGVSTVFSFLPPWLWQMMWYILGALAVIALLKVVIS